MPSPKRDTGCSTEALHRGVPSDTAVLTVGFDVRNEVARRRPSASSVAATADR
jgi:hypothetical protein